MILLVLASVVGFAVALVLLWPYGAVIALIGASFAGSILAGLCGLWLALGSPESKRARRTFTSKEGSQAKHQSTL